jgi:eukaryotic-like serine/threonine-protein kinase
MELTVQNIYGLLLRSRLMPDQTAHTVFQAWKQEAGAQAQDVARFAKWLVARHYLTEYQVGLLASGYAEGFFLGEYKILDRLGGGRLAGIYRAVHESGQVVAVKVLPPSKAREPQTLARFQREAHLALKLNHANVVRSFQVGEADGLHYLVMENLDGEPVDEVMQRRGRFPPAESARLVYQALLGLEHIHQQRLVHRDLNPTNLMLVPPPGEADTSKCTVKILDIGLGREIFDEAGAVKAHHARLTTTGVLLGTPEYMSPEQGRDARAADIRSDIYSLGCVLYRLIAGQAVFPDTNVISQMIRHASEEPRPLKEFNATVPDGLQQIVSTMLAKEPGKRYATPAHAAEALRAFLNTGADVGPRIEPSPEMRSYLTWLEKADKKQAASGVGAGVPAIASLEGLTDAGPTKAGTPTAAKAVAKAARAAARKESRRARKKPDRAQALMPTIPPAPAPAEAPGDLDHMGDFEPDVQLVPMAAPPASSPLRVTWRDFLMFTLGVFGALAAIGAAYLLARLLA